MIDIDAHHGNGTQAIFYDDPGVLVGSVHVDPGAGWFPHFMGFEDETGGGANRNVPLAPGSGDDEWLEAVRGLAAWALEGGASALVVPLGVDAAAGDPESQLGVTAGRVSRGGPGARDLRLADGAGAGGRLRPRTRSAGWSTRRSSVSRRASPGKATENRRVQGQRLTRGVLPPVKA